MASERRVAAAHAARLRRALPRSRRLGAGGMGEVFAVHDTTRDTMVALNLVTLHELMASEGGREWYLTMDRVDGVDVVSFVRHGAVAPAAIADAAPEALLRAAMGMAEAADMGP